MKSNEFKLLNTSDSWRSQLSVIVHIDLDAFYSQCQAISLGIPPEKPLASRQWQSIIAVSYSARKYGIKRGMDIKTCLELCPEIELPHVPTFKKGSTSWKLEKNPQTNTHKVSLDMFRAESRKIFRIFRATFKKVEKAGIDEGFVDLGPEVYEEALAKYPQLRDLEDSMPLPPPDFQCWQDALLTIGADLVHRARLAIHQQLKYTCSAGIASTKQVAKLGSAFNKPFNQTLVLWSARKEFLAKHKFTDIWGWGGKRGTQVLEVLGVDDSLDDIVTLGFDVILNKIDDMERAKYIFETANGSYRAEVKLRTTIKSMASVKNFGSSPINTMEDFRQWLIVYCSDLSGRLDDLTLDDPNGLVYRPSTVSVKIHGGITKTTFNKQAPCSLPYHKSCLEALTTAVNSILPNEKKVLPCLSLSIDLSNIKGVKPTSFFKSRDQPGSTAPAQEDGEDGNLFVSEDTHYCKKCHKYIPWDEESEHKDWHLAKSLQTELNSSPIPAPAARPSPTRSAVQKKSSSSRQQTTLTNFFKKHK